MCGTYFCARWNIILDNHITVVRKTSEALCMCQVIWNHVFTAGTLRTVV